MSTQTEHFDLDLREAADIFNPLSSNSNFETLDSVIYDVKTLSGVPLYTTTASNKLLKLSDNPTPNVTVFKFVAAGDANTWTYQETINNIVSLDGEQKTVKSGELYVAYINAANSMVVIAWPDIVNAQTFDGKGPAEWASKVELDAVDQKAVNSTTIAQAAAAVANGMKLKNSSVISGNYTKTKGQALSIPCSWNSPFAISISVTEGNDNIDVRTFCSWWGKAVLGFGITNVDYPNRTHDIVVVKYAFSTTSFVIDRIYKLVDGTLTELDTDIFSISVAEHTQE